MSAEERERAAASLRRRRKRKIEWLQICDVGSERERVEDEKKIMKS
jgi:hypothetical protein